MELFVRRSGSPEAHSASVPPGPQRPSPLCLGPSLFRCGYGAVLIELVGVGFSWAATWFASHSWAAARTGGAGSGLAICGVVCTTEFERRWAVLLGNTQSSIRSSRNAKGELSFEEESPEVRRRLENWSDAAVICEVWFKPALEVCCF